MLKIILLTLYLFISLLHANKTESIFVLHSYSQEYPWTKGQNEGFIKELEKMNVHISTEYLDTKRLSFTQEYRSFFFKYLKNKYKNFKPKLIYVTDDNALDFIIEYKESLFPNAKVVFSGVNNLSATKNLDHSNYIGIFEKKDPKNNIEIIKQMFPSQKNICFAGDNSNTDAAIMDSLKNITIQYPTFNFTFLSYKEISEVSIKLQELPSSIVILTTIGKFVNKKIESISITQAIKNLTESKKHVIMVMEDAYLKENIIGGYVTSSAHQGGQAGTIAIQLLQGHLVNKAILVSKSANMYIFDRQELNKQKLLLPKDIEQKALILNENVSIWEQYKTLLQYSFLLLTFLLIAVLVIFLYIYRKKNYIIEARSNHLKDKTEELLSNISKQREDEKFKDKHSKILEMIATGVSASEVYDAIALMYEDRHPGMRCSLLELENGILLHRGAPSMPQEYCDAVHGLKNGPNVGSCGASTYTGKRILVENIDTHPNWADIKQVALPHGMRSCWSEPIKSSSGEVLGAFGMYYNYPSLPNEEESKDLLSAARIDFS